MSYYAGAVAEAVLLGALAGIVGVLVVVRRRAFFTTALTHSTFPGAIVAVTLGIAPAVGAAVFSLVLVGLMTALAGVRRLGSEVAAGVTLTSGFALGVTLQAANPQLPIQVESFLVGSILTVDMSDVALTAGMLVLALAVFAGFGKELLYSSVDPAGFRAAGFRPRLAEAVTLVLIAGTVVVAMPAVGSILAIALIVGPAAAARLWSRSIVGMLLTAPLAGVAVSVGGLVVSSALGLSAGGVITLLAAAVFLGSLAARRLVSRPKVRWEA